MRLLGKFVLNKILLPPVAYRGSGAVFSTAAAKVHQDNVQDVKPFEDIPGPKGIYQWPFIGSMLYFKPFTDFTPETSHLLIEQMFNKYGPIYKWRLANRQMVVISDPKDIETVYRNEGKLPNRPSLEMSYIYAKRNNCRVGMTDMVGEEWQALRAPLNKRLMKADSAHCYLQVQNLVADEFVKILATKHLKPENMGELFFLYAIESIGLVCFNARLGFLDPDITKSPEAAVFLKASKNVFAQMHKTLAGKSVAHKWYRNKTYRSYEKSRRVLTQNVCKYIEEAKQGMETQKRSGTFNHEEPNLLLSLLSDNSIHFDDITNLTEALFVAGTDSTAKNLQAFFYNLALYPDKQEKLREEIMAILGPDQPLTSAALGQLQYLKASLKESFRILYPTVSGSFRILPTDVVLQGYRVPAGTYISMHNPKSCKVYFSNSDKFIPERWLRSSDGQLEDIPKMANLPFGYGPRHCVGRRFAEQEIYLAVVKVLQKQKISVDSESSNMNFVYQLFISPEKPIKFKFTILDK